MELQKQVHTLLEFDTINITDGDVYIVSDGSHVSTNCFVTSGTLVIEKDARVSVLGDASVGKEGTLIVLGTIVFYTDDEPAFYGQVYVDGGKIEGDYSVPNGVINGHIIEDGICVICGLEMGVSSLGSALSGGNIAIITAVAGVVFGFVCGLLIGKKKKKLATAGVAEKEIKDEE